jgi:hypothetical protein
MTLCILEKSVKGPELTLASDLDALTSSVLVGKD